MDANQRLPDAGAAQENIEKYALMLETDHAHLPSQAIVELVLERLYPGRVTAISSFGADSAILLHMISKIDRTTPVVFLDTGKHFSKTLKFRDALVNDFGLTDVRAIAPDPGRLRSDDPTGNLHRLDADACCAIRKVEPMNRAVEPFAAWLTGRKRFQSATRSALRVFEAVGPRMRINPLANLTADEIRNYLFMNEIREHPLVAHGYLSIGCEPCSAPVKPGEQARSGRWAGLGKTECGIHFPADAKARPATANPGAN